MTVQNPNAVHLMHLTLWAMRGKPLAVYSLPEQPIAAEIYISSTEVVLLVSFLSSIAKYTITNGWANPQAVVRIESTDSRLREISSIEIIEDASDGKYYVVVTAGRNHHLAIADSRLRHLYSFVDIPNSGGQRLVGPNEVDCAFDAPPQGNPQAVTYTCYISNGPDTRLVALSVDLLVLKQAEAAIGTADVETIAATAIQYKTSVSSTPNTGLPVQFWSLFDPIGVTLLGTTDTGRLLAVSEVKTLISINWSFNIKTAVLA
eukprot:GHVT01058555.1.p3 GENE.GHVT01058555.1~~GHVT01058555.1.p3  ORF type:complete len:261 (+),score=17.46 GHVT01058555.1:1298-2080(+)